ncbi:hypothetical protein QM859_03895 [Streptococcus infantis]
MWSCCTWCCAWSRRSRFGCKT